MDEPDKKAEDTIFREARQSRPGENSDLVFYYSSERRARRAAALEQKNTRPGFIKSLIGSRGNLFLLISIFGIFLIFFLGVRASSNQSQGSFHLGQNTVALSALEEEKIFYLIIHKKSPSWGSAYYTGPVDISAAPALSIGEGGPAFVTQRVFFSNNSPEVFRLYLPFESDDIMVILRTENETVMRTVKK